MNLASNLHCSKALGFPSGTILKVVAAVEVIKKEQQRQIPTSWHSPSYYEFLAELAFERLYTYYSIKHGIYVS